MGSAVPVLQRRSMNDWQELGIVCPRCRGPWRDVGLDRLMCDACGSAFPVVCGIPDLRTGTDPYLTTDEDIGGATRLMARADGLDFAALYASYYEGNPKVPPAQAAQFTRGVLAAAPRAGASLEVWESLSRPLGIGGVILDLGCGTAPLGIRLASLGHRVVGLDAGLRWLVLARKRAAEQGVDLPVVCANAEALPIADGALQAVVGESFLEHLVDVAQGIREAHRCLAHLGSLWLTTPNKRSLGPDPHLGIVAAGWWPEMRLRARAAREGKVFPKRRLFAPGELAALLAIAGFGGVRMALPRFTDAQRFGLSRPINLAIDGYHLARRTPILRTLVMSIGPTIVCTASRI